MVESWKKKYEEENALAVKLSESYRGLWRSS